MKTIDGRGIVQTMAYDVLAGSTTLVAAPGAGFRIRVYSWAGNGAGGGTLRLRNVAAGTVVADMSLTTGGRPFALDNSRGIAVCDANDALEINQGAVALQGTLTFAVEPAV